MTTYDHIYPELVGFRQQGEQIAPVQFPDHCPCCKAPKVSRDSHEGTVWAHRYYSCGGTYEPKPQIQNHTRYWWGQCPKAKAASAVGLSPDVPDYILADAREEAGLPRQW